MKCPSCGEDMDEDLAEEGVCSFCGELIDSEDEELDKKSFREFEGDDDFKDEDFKDSDKEDDEDLEDDDDE